MSLSDKVNILFADSNLSAESYGQKRVLSSDERKNLIKDACKKQEFETLRCFNKYYNLAHWILHDLRARVLGLELKLSQLDTLVLGCSFMGHVKSLNQDLSFLNEFNDDYSWFISSKGERKVNHHVQYAFINAILACRSLKQGLLMLDLLEKNASNVQFFSEEDEKSLEEIRDIVEVFHAEEGSLSVIKMYRTAYSLNILQKKDFISPVFEQYLIDPDGALELTQVEKDEAECTLDLALDLMSYPIT